MEKIVWKEYDSVFWNAWENEKGSESEGKSGEENAFFEKYLENSDEVAECCVVRWVQ